MGVHKSGHEAAGKQCRSMAYEASEHLMRFQPPRVVGLIWAAPYSLLGMTIGVAGLCSGGTVRSCDGVLEFSGGLTQRFVQRLPGGEFALAITLGHTVLGQTEAALDIAHEHELVHVRQYERWGPFFGPAYLGASLVIWLRGGDPYRENPFEREAYDAVPENG